MTNQEIIQAARAEQGGDAYPGIDRYKVKTLPPGTHLVKLEPSGSGFFIPLSEYKKIGPDATNLSQGYQVGPWVNQNLAKQSDPFIYRNHASLFITTREIKVASGPTDANLQYGKGTFIQNHIAGFVRDDSQIQHNLGLKKVSTITLANIGLDKQSGESIELTRAIYTQIRNYHAYLAQTQELMKLRDSLTSPGHIRICNDRLKALQDIISDHRKEIKRNLGQFHSLYPTLPQPTAPTYEKAIRYQERLAAALDKTQVIDPKMEKESRDLREHLTAKVEMTAGKVIRGEWKPGECDREVKIDEVRKLYESDQFVKRALCQKQLADNSARISQLERAIIQFDRHDSDLADRGRLGHTIQEPPPGLAGELNALREQGQTLRGELRGLETRQADYHQFLTLCNKGPELSGPGLRFSS
jgi:hypothetical protein